MKTRLNRKISVAPMMDWTDRHCRYLHRILSRETLLYTEMVTAPALIHGDRERLLGFDPSEHPVALQIGGSDPAELAQATALGVAAGYNEVNLNVGCPSDRVQSGKFGACLMKEPELVADCVAAMIEASSGVEITVKCRIGVDEQNPSEILPAFLRTVSATGVRSFTIHARMAWLQGLSPKENRDIPPLNYPLVYQMKRENPDLEIIINGGIATLAQAQTHLDAGVDGVMIGRAAYHDPMAILAPVDEQLFNEPNSITAPQAVEKMLPYVENHIANGGRLNHITRHMLGLFAGQPGARIWKRYLSENAHKDGAGAHTLQDALDQVLDAQAKLLAAE